MQVIVLCAVNVYGYYIHVLYKFCHNIKNVQDQWCSSRKSFESPCLKPVAMFCRVWKAWTNMLGCPLQQSRPPLWIVRLRRFVNDSPESEPRRWNLLCQGTLYDISIKVWTELEITSDAWQNGRKVRIQSSDLPKWRCTLWRIFVWHRTSFQAVCR